MSLLSSDFEPFKIKTSEDPVVEISGCKAGSGPPLLLVHGFPQTHLIWHKIVPELIKKYTVVLVDIRGYGASSKPKGSDDHHEYAKSEMAKDLAVVMKELGYDQYYVVGHDRGGRVSHKLAVDYPSQVKKLMVLDICPTLAMYGGTDQEFATYYFHWFFLIQPTPWPEKMMVQNAELSASKFIKGGKSGIMHPEAYKAYEALFADEETCHGMCEDYRAAATIDLKQQQDDIDNGRKIQCPMRVLWGKKGVVELKFNAIEEWKKVCSNDVSGEALPCGHYVPEEDSEGTLNHILEFMKD